MFERIYEYLLSEPQRLISFGNNFVRGGLFIIVLGAAGNVARGASSIALSFGKQAEDATTLAALYPSIPTWFVPESIIGCIPAVVLIVFGIILATLGRRLKRVYF